MTCSKFIKEDKQFNERCRQLRSSFSPSALSLPSDYHCPYPLTLSDLRKLQRCELPLEKLYCLQDVMVSHHSLLYNVFILNHLSVLVCLY